jgi:hypothetical protein
MEIGSSSEVFVAFYQTALGHITEDGDIVINEAYLQLYLIWTVASPMLLHAALLHFCIALQIFHVSVMLVGFYWLCCSSGSNLPVSHRG